MAEIVTNQSDEKKEAIHAYPHTQAVRERKKEIWRVFSRKERKKLEKRRIKMAMKLIMVMYTNDT